MSGSDDTKRQRSPGSGPGVAALCHDPLPLGGVAVALMLGTYGLFGLPVDRALLAAAFCGTALVYLVERVWVRPPEDRINHPERVAWIQKHAVWLDGEAAILFAGAGTSVFYLRGATVLWSAILAGVSLLHVVPRQRLSLKEGGLSKPVLIAGAWAVGAGGLPLIEAAAPVGVGVVLFCGYRFVFVLPNLLMVDWSDRSGDVASGRSPWAARWTAAEVRWTATGLLATGVAGAGLWIVGGDIPLLVAFDAVGLLLMLGVVWTLDVHRPRHALLADLVVGWPVMSYLAAWMIV